MMVGKGDFRDQRLGMALGQHPLLSLDGAVGHIGGIILGKFCEHSAGCAPSGHPSNSAAVTRSLVTANFATSPSRASTSTRPAYRLSARAMIHFTSRA